MMNDSMLKHIRLNDAVFAPRQETNWKTTIPSCIRRCEETGRLKAFKLQWKEGDPDMPHIYWDSDVAKVLEGMAASLQVHPDPELEKQLKDSFEGLRELTLDFSKLEYISSAGLRVLLAAQKIMNQQGSLKVMNVNETIMEIFEVTGFSDILTII